MAAVMIGIDPHKASHTAVVISAAEEPLGELRVRACAAQAEQLLAWAAAWPERTWAVEGAAGLGHLLAQQLLSAGQRVLDVQPKLGARVRLLAAGDTNKNDPNDARSVAVAALRSPGVREAVPDDHAAVLKVWSKRYRDLGRSRTQVVCRLHAVLCELVPGGVAKAITAAAAARLLDSIVPAGAVDAARCELAAAFIEDLRRIDAQLRATSKTLTTAVQAAGTSLTTLFGVGPVIAAAVIGDVKDVSRFPSRDRFAAYNGTAPIEVSSGRRKVYRLSRRGNRRLNHAIHMAAVTQVRHRHSEGRAYYDKKLAEGKTPKEAMRSLKRQVSNAIYTRLQADARRAAARAGGPGGQPGNDSVASAAGLHPAGRLFGQATPGPAHHTTTTPGSPAPGSRAGHSSIAAILPPTKPRVQVERPQRSEDERPGGAARRRPQSAARKAPGQDSLARTQRPKGTSHPAKKANGNP
ncbi:MAG: IS110 family transposase [Actinomycetota bacterium]|nr:IS110 family transposase [Actinomycetota bacterium]